MSKDTLTKEQQMITLAILEAVKKIAKETGEKDLTKISIPIDDLAGFLIRQTRDEDSKHTVYPVGPYMKGLK